MEQLPEDVVIRDLRNSADCVGRICKVTREMAQSQIDGVWWQIGGSRSKRRQEGDHSWKWTQILGEHRGNAFREVLALETQDHAIQGAISYWINGKSILNSELGAVFVHHIATAPRNRPWLIDSPQYQGVGTNLLFYAVRHSYSLGLGGRITLVSLGSEKTRQFYVNRGFTEIVEDEDGNIEYELETDAAERWLREKGWLE